MPYWDKCGLQKLIQNCTHKCGHILYILRVLTNVEYSTSKVCCVALRIYRMFGHYGGMILQNVCINVIVKPQKC